MGRMGVNTGEAVVGVTFATKETSLNPPDKGMDMAYRKGMLEASSVNANVACIEATHDLDGRDLTAIQAESIQGLQKNLGVKATLESPQFSNINKEASTGKLGEDTVFKVMFPEGIAPGQKLTADLLADSLDLPIGVVLTEKRRMNVERTRHVEAVLDNHLLEVIGKGSPKEQVMAMIDATKSMCLEEYTKFLDLDFRAIQILQLISDPKIDSASKLRASVLLSETIAKANEIKSTMEAVLTATKVASKQNVFQRFVVKFTNRNPIPGKQNLGWDAIHATYTASYKNALLVANRPGYRNPSSSSRQSKPQFNSFGSPIRVGA